MGIPRQLQARLDQYEAQAKPANGAAPADAANAGAGGGADTSQQPGTQASQAADGAATTQEAGTGTAHATPAGDPTGTRADAELDADASLAGGSTATGADAAGSDVAWRRTEGRYKAQIKRLEDRIGELTEHARGTSVIADLLAQTRAELAEMRAAKQGGADTAEAKPDPTALTDEELEMFGEFAPVADKLIAKNTAPLRAKIEELERQTGAVGQRAAKTEEDRFVDRVRTSVPDFDSIVNDPDWPEYSQRKIPLTSLTLLGALEDAHNARDLDRVSSILNAFASQRADAAQRATGTTQQAATTGGTATNTADRPVNGLAQFATPASASNNPPGKPTPKFRASDYQARMSDLRARRITTTEFEAFDHEFQQAKRAGLVA